MIQWQVMNSLLGIWLGPSICIWLHLSRKTHRSKMQKDGWAKYIQNFAFNCCWHDEANNWQLSVHFFKSYIFEISAWSREEWAMSQLSCPTYKIISCLPCILRGHQEVNSSYKCRVKTDYFLSWRRKLRHSSSFDSRLLI